MFRTAICALESSSWSARAASKVSSGRSVIVIVWSGLPAPAGSFGKSTLPKSRRDLCTPDFARGLEDKIEGICLFMVSFARAALAALFIVAIFTAWGIVIGSVLVFIPFVLWAWPRKDEQHERLTPEIDPLARAGQ